VAVCLFRAAYASLSSRCAACFRWRAFRPSLMCLLLSSRGMVGALLCASFCTTNTPRYCCLVLTFVSILSPSSLLFAGLSSVFTGQVIRPSCLLFFIAAYAARRSLEHFLARKIWSSRGATAESGGMRLRLCIYAFLLTPGPASKCQIPHRRPRIFVLGIFLSSLGMGHNAPFLVSLKQRTFFGHFRSSPEPFRLLLLPLLAGCSLPGSTPVAAGPCLVLFFFSYAEQLRFFFRCIRSALFFAVTRRAVLFRPPFF